jgi:hypothetical protein
MLRPRTLKILAVLLATYALLAAPAYLGPSYLEELGGYPTAFGWAFLIAFWLGVAWLAAWGVARVTARR